MIFLGSPARPSPYKAIGLLGRPDNPAHFYSSSQNSEHCQHLAPAPSPPIHSPIKSQISGVIYVSFLINPNPNFTYKTERKFSEKGGAKKDNQPQTKKKQ
jgi:hypothetical protein